jgi:hypothetical protein
LNQLSFGSTHRARHSVCVAAVSSLCDNGFRGVTTGGTRDRNPSEPTGWHVSCGVPQWLRPLLGAAFIENEPGVVHTGASSVRSDQDPSCTWPGIRAAGAMRRAVVVRVQGAVAEQVHGIGFSCTGRPARRSALSGGAGRRRRRCWPGLDELAPVVVEDLRPAEDLATGKAVRDGVVPAPTHPTHRATLGPAPVPGGLCGRWWSGEGEDGRLGR